jgi:hypothetical protein
MLKLPPRGAGVTELAKLASLSVLSKMATSPAPGAAPRTQLAPLVKVVLLLALVTSAELRCGSNMAAASISAKDSLTAVRDDNAMVTLSY